MNLAGECKYFSVHCASNFKDVLLHIGFSLCIWTSRFLYFCKFRGIEILCMDSLLKKQLTLFCPPNGRGRGQIASGADPVGISVGVCLGLVK